MASPSRPACGIRRAAGTVAQVKSRGARPVLVVIGAIALVTGGVWMGQGMNLIPGSFMTGDRTWLLIGLVVAVVGLGLIASGLRRPADRRRS